MGLLATAADAAPAVPVDKLLPWLSSLVIGLVGLVLRSQAKRKGFEEGRKQTLQIEPSPLLVAKAPQPPSWEQHRELIRRVSVVEEELEELRKEQARQYREILIAGSERESRLADKLDGVARAIHSRIDELMTNFTAKK